MLPMQAVRLRIGTLLAADATTLAPAADANVLALIAADFGLAETLVVGDLTLASFDGSTPIAVPLAAQQVAIDPSTLQQVITIKEPLGSYRWVTSGLTNLPQTIFGFALLTNGLASLLAVEKFGTPISLTAVGQEIDLGNVKLTILPQPIS